MVWSSKIFHTSDWSSLIISYMSKRTNNFSGDLLLLAIASPKLRSTDTLFVVTSAKHWSLRISAPSNIWLHTFFSAAKSSLTCFTHYLNSWKNKNTTRSASSKPYSNPHVMYPIPNLSLQNLPLHFLNIIFSKSLHT